MDCRWSLQLLSCSFDSTLAARPSMKGFLSNSCRLDVLGFVGVVSPIGSGVPWMWSLNVRVRFSVRLLQEQSYTEVSCATSSA